MAERKILPAYLASFRMGTRLIVRDRGDLISKLFIYAVLLLIFYSIFSIMPLEQLNAPNITARHLLWYFAMTEIVTVGALGLRRDVGRIIADGQLTTLMQRPGGMIFMILTRLFGSYMTIIALLLAATLATLPLVGLPMPMPLTQMPILLVMLTLAGLISLLLGCLSGMFEILGPYSQPVDWILHKFVMALGGLFFPVCFFPPLIQHLVMLTPFPSILYAPGSLMLGTPQATITNSIFLQIFWLLTLGTLTLVLENKAVRRVMRTGD